MKIWRTRWWLNGLNGCVQMAENCQQLWIDGEMPAIIYMFVQYTFLYVDAWNTAGKIAGIHWEMPKSTPKINIQIHWHWICSFFVCFSSTFFSYLQWSPWFAVLLTGHRWRGRFSGRPGGWWIFRWFRRRCTKEPVPLDAGQWCHSNLSSGML